MHRNRTLDIQYKPCAGALVGTTYTATLSFTLNIPVNSSVSLTGTPFTGLNTYYIHSDHLDSPRSITNTAGQEVWRWDNTDPFGNNIANENPSNLGAFTFNLRFLGQYFDRETGLHYNVNRDYNPAVGRYVQSDPIGLGGGINTFGYVGGNPLGWSDPTGKNALAGAEIGGEIGTMIFPGVGTAMGIIVGGIGGYLIGDAISNAISNSQAGDTASKPPAGSKGIDESSWSGDHQGIKGAAGAGPADNVKISPNEDVWIENPDGSWTNAGPASDYTGSGKPAGRKGKDRNKRNCP